MTPERGWAIMAVSELCRPEPEDIPLDDLLTPGEVSKRYGVPEKTLADWRSRGIGPAYLRLGRHCRYRLEDVVRYEESRRVVTPTSAA